MEFLDAVHARSMTRRFLSDPIEAALLDRLCQSALRSPSAGFSQGVDLLVLTEATARATFWESVADESWIESERGRQGIVVAPTIVVPYANPEAYTERYREDDKRDSPLWNRPAAAWSVPYWTVDAAFATMTMLLAATDSGLGALFFHLRDRDNDVATAFRVPSHYVSIGAIAIGRAAPIESTPRRRTRRQIAEAVHHERW